MKFYQTKKSVKKSVWVYNQSGKTIFRGSLEQFSLEMLTGGQSPPASISRQGFASKSLQSSPTFSKLNRSGAGAGVA
jgi:hypothetical protein